MANQRPLHAMSSSTAVHTLVRIIDGTGVQAAARTPKQTGPGVVEIEGREIPGPRQSPRRSLASPFPGVGGEGVKPSANTGAFQSPSATGTLSYSPIGLASRIGPAAQHDCRSLRHRVSSGLRSSTRCPPPGGGRGAPCRRSLGPGPRWAAGAGPPTPIRGPIPPAGKISFHQPGTRAKIQSEK